MVIGSLTFMKTLSNFLNLITHFGAFPVHSGDKRDFVHNKLCISLHGILFCKLQYQSFFHGGQRGQFQNFQLFASLVPERYQATILLQLIQFILPKVRVVISRLIVELSMLSFGIPGEPCDLRSIDEFWKFSVSRWIAIHILDLGELNIACICKYFESQQIWVVRHYSMI